MRSFLESEYNRNAVREILGRDVDRLRSVLVSDSALAATLVDALRQDATAGSATRGLLRDRLALHICHAGTRVQDAVALLQQGSVPEHLSRALDGPAEPSSLPGSVVTQDLP